MVEGWGGGGAGPLYEDASDYRDGEAAVTRRYVVSVSTGGVCGVGLERKDGFPMGGRW